MYSTHDSQRIGWVSPFGNPRIKVCCRLPEAYRRLPRPSSPSAAKASTECACSLDHITQPACARLSFKTSERRRLPVPELALRHSAVALTHHRTRRTCCCFRCSWVASLLSERCGFIERIVKERLMQASIQGHRCRCAWMLTLRGRRESGGAEEDRTPDPLRARQVLSQLSYGPVSSSLATVDALARRSPSAARLGQGTLRLGGSGWI